MVLACSRCGGRLRLIALIEHPRILQRALGHHGLRCEVPAARPSRAERRRNRVHASFYRLTTPARPADPLEVLGVDPGRMLLYDPAQLRRDSVRGFEEELRRSRLPPTSPVERS